MRKRLNDDDKEMRALFRAVKELVVRFISQSPEKADRIEAIGEALSACLTASAALTVEMAHFSKVPIEEVERFAKEELTRARKEVEANLAFEKHN